MIRINKEQQVVQIDIDVAQWQLSLPWYTCPGPAGMLEPTGMLEATGMLGHTNAMSRVWKASVLNLLYISFFCGLAMNVVKAVIRILAWGLLKM